jgi:cellulose synthase (UDP-forming)
MHMPVEIQLPDGESIFGESVDMSLGGAAITLEKAFALPPDSQIQVIYPLRRRQASFPASVVSVSGANLRLKYKELSLEEEELLTLVLYSRADSWLSRSERREADRPLRSFGRLVRLSIKGVGYALGTLVPKRKTPELAEAVRAGTAVVVIAGLLGWASLPLQAQRVKKSAASPAVSLPAATAPAEGTFQSTFTLKDIGMPEALLFRGVAASRNLRFSLPQTEVAQTATLHLRYAFSPGLIAQMSHLNVFLNGTLVDTLPMPQKIEDVQGALKADLRLPSELLVRDNVLGFEFIGHYTQQCEDPANTILWSRVENSSSIDVSGSLLPLADDLKILPLPFYDGALSSASTAVPFAFTSDQPSNIAIQAAGVVASWFGVLAKSRPLSFPVTFGSTLPKGNVVLFVENHSAMPAGIDLGGDGPTIAVRTNPEDPYGKVLIIAGDNADQLLTAARAVAAGNAMLQGTTVHISGFQLPEARKSDDAPLWMRTDRLSPFWDYSGDAELQSDGSGPLPVYLRIPPDLYYGDLQNIPLHMDYRYNAIPLANGSTLRVSANGSLVNELPLPHENNPKRTLSYNVAVPLANMRPFANTFLFNFYFQMAKTGNCQDTPPINLQGAVLRSSYLDIRGLKHWAALPNLELFANAGFPFTRFADLSQTEIVVPPRPTTAELGVYLALLAYFGEQTGYPAIRVNVSDSSSLGGDFDYLILGTPDDQPAFARLHEQLPIEVKEQGYAIHDMGGFFASVQHAWWQVAEMRPNWWWKVEHSSDRDGLLETLGQFPDALIQGIESPWSSSRSIVSIALKNDDAASGFVAAFMKSSTSGDISESVSVLHGGGFTSYRLGDRFYHVGDLPWWSRVRYFLRAFPWMIVLLTFVLGLFVVPWTRAWLDRRAKARLEAQAT